MPVVRSAAVVKVEGYTAENPEIQELDLVLDVEYTGSCQVAVDADLVTNPFKFSIPDSLVIIILLGFWQGSLRCSGIEQSEREGKTALLQKR